MGIEHNTIILSWNQVIPGREALAGELFASRISYLDKCQKSGRLESWEPVLMSPHGGAPVGFFILRGTCEHLNQLVVDGEFQELNLRATCCLSDFAVLMAYRGKAAQDVLSVWAKVVPR